MAHGVIPRADGSPLPQLAGLLLTGGLSRRMGRDKASIELEDGRTLAERVGQLLEEICAPALEVGPGRSRLASVGERHPGQGPLTALAEGWAKLEQMGHRGHTLVVACDLPHITAGVLQLIGRWPGSGCAVPVVGDRDQPLCARWSAPAMRSCAELVGQGHRSLRRLLERPDVDRIDAAAWSVVADATAFADVDTPEDLKTLGVRARA